MCLQCFVNNSTHTSPAKQKTGSAEAHAGIHWEQPMHLSMDPTVLRSPTHREHRPAFRYNWGKKKNNHFCGISYVRP